MKLPKIINLYKLYPLKIIIKNINIRLGLSRII